MLSLQVIPDGSVTSPAGFDAGVASAGLRSGSHEPDVAVVSSDRPCTTAAVFTQNPVRAAPVAYDLELRARHPGDRYGVVVNAGIANACTGPPGLATATRMATATEQALGRPPHSILVLSTGVIGPLLPEDRVAEAVAEAARARGPGHGIAAARAIMTTDTCPKHAAVRVHTPRGPITIGGIAKGSGMIHPDMATMLAIIGTDARIDEDRLTSGLGATVNRTFNAITVDGDTSTNDAVVCLANGASGVDVGTDPATFEAFADGLHHLARHLAIAIARDGEGATRLVEIAITGAPNASAARRVGRAIGRSLLVKAALHGEEANWGRVLAAAGTAGVPLDPRRLTLDVQQRLPAGGPAGPWIPVVRHGTLVPVSEPLPPGGTDLILRLDLDAGSADATVWGCDLTEAYVRLNAGSKT